MLSNKFKRYIAPVSFILIAVLLILVPVGCTTAAPSGPAVTELSATTVPNLDLDIYLYFNQGNPTIIPEESTSSSKNIAVDSLAVWGIINDNDYAIAGALTFDNAADAANMFSQLPKQPVIWTELSGNIVYAVYGSGTPADSLESAISNKDFKQYDDSQALQEVSRLPYNDTTKPAGIGIIKTSSATVNLLKQHVGSSTADTINSIYTWAKPKLLTLGFYSSQTINLANIAQQIKDNTLKNTDLGVVAAIDSSYPGSVFGPIADKYLDEKGYDKTTLGNLTVYKTYPGSWNKSVPVLINVNGSHIFATAAVNEAYADTLMTDIKR